MIGCGELVSSSVLPPSDSVVTVQSSAEMSFEPISIQLTVSTLGVTYMPAVA